MTCGICGSEEHFRANCPQGGSSTSAHITTAHSFTTYTGLGPLGDLLQEEPQTQTYVTLPTESIPYTSPFARPATPPAATPRVDGVWSFDSDPSPFIPRATPENG